MFQFATEQNIRRFRELLDAEQDLATRGRLEALLAEEQAKLAGHCTADPVVGSALDPRARSVPKP